MRVGFDEQRKTMIVEASEHGSRADMDDFLDQAVEHFHVHGKLKLMLNWLNYHSNSIEVQKAGLYASANMKTMFSKIAVICNPEHQKEASNWKSATGLNIRVFLPAQRDEMQQWLRGQ